MVSVNSILQPGFRSLCESHGLAVTHQRQVIFEVMSAMEGHPSPEQVYVLVKERIPAISLATVYKNIHLFVDGGLFAEVSPHHGSMRVEINSTPHYHLVCRKCRKIADLPPEAFGCLTSSGQLPGGFRAERFVIEVLGVCAECQHAEQKS